MLYTQVWPQKRGNLLPKLCLEDRCPAGDRLGFIAPGRDACGVLGSPAAEQGDISAQWSFKDQGTKILDIRAEVSSETF